MKKLTITELQVTHTALRLYRNLVVTHAPWHEAVNAVLRALEVELDESPESKPCAKT